MPLSNSEQPDDESSFTGGELSQVNTVDDESQTVQENVVHQHASPLFTANLSTPSPPGPTEKAESGNIASYPEPGDQAARFRISPSTDPHQTFTSGRRPIPTSTDPSSFLLRPEQRTSTIEPRARVSLPQRQPEHPAKSDPPSNCDDDGLDYKPYTKAGLLPATTKPKPSPEALLSMMSPSPSTHKLYKRSTSNDATGLGLVSHLDEVLPCKWFYPSWNESKRVGTLKGLADCIAHTYKDLHSMYVTAASAKGTPCYDAFEAAHQHFNGRVSLPHVVQRAVEITWLATSKENPDTATTTVPLQLWLCTPDSKIDLLQTDIEAGKFDAASLDEYCDITNDPPSHGLRRLDYEHNPTDFTVHWDNLYCTIVHCIAYTPLPDHSAEEARDKFFVFTWQYNTGGPRTPVLKPGHDLLQRDKEFVHQLIYRHTAQKAETTRSIDRDPHAQHLHIQPYEETINLFFSLSKSLAGIARAIVDSAMMRGEIQPDHLNWTYPQIKSICYRAEQIQHLRQQQNSMFNLSSGLHPRTPKTTNDPKGTDRKGKGDKGGKGGKGDRKQTRNNIADPPPDPHRTAAPADGTPPADGANTPTPPKPPTKPPPPHPDDLARGYTPLDSDFVTSGSLRAAHIKQHPNGC